MHTEVEEKTTPSSAPLPTHYEVFADGKRIYSGHDWVASVLACSEAGPVYGAQWVERWADGGRLSRLQTRQPA